MSAASLLLGCGQAGAQITAAQWKTMPEYRALRMQYQLSKDMPLDQCLIMATHNSYNAANYPGVAYPVPNHTYRMDEQLDFGVRLLNIDVHWILGVPSGIPYVTHATVCSSFGGAGMRLSDHLLEIRNWLLTNPDEVVFISFEEFLSTDQLVDNLVQVVELTLGNQSGHDYLFRRSDTDVSDVPYRRELTLRRVVNAGKRVVIWGGSGGECHGHTTDGSGLRGTTPDAIHYNWWRPYVTDMPGPPAEHRNYFILGAKDFESGALQGRYWESAPLGSQPTYVYTDVNQVTHRTWDGEMYHSVESRASGDADQASYGQITPTGVREAVRAGTDMIWMDPMGTSQAAVGNGGVTITRDAAQMMTAAIWSWDPAYLPPERAPNGPLLPPLGAMACFTGDTARLRAVDPGTVMRYARQNSLGEWSISSNSGSLAQGQSNTDFTVPGNGFEMQNLAGAMIRAGVTRVWVNYADLDGDGLWTAATRPRNLQDDSATYPSPVLCSPVIQVSSLGTLAQLSLQLPLATQPLIASVNPAGVYPGAVVLNGPITVVPSNVNGPVVIGR